MSEIFGLSDVLGLIHLAWLAFSPFGLVLGAGGIGLLLVVSFGVVALPGWLSRSLLVAGGLLLAAGALYEAGFARATLADEKRLALEIALAQQTRAEAAERIARDLSAQTARDRAAIALSNSKLQDLTHALDTRPDRDRVCVPRDLARRLRAL